MRTAARKKNQPYVWESLMTFKPPAFYNSGATHLQTNINKRTSSHGSRPLASATALLYVTMCLTGCPGMEDNEMEDGLVIHIAETHSEALTVTSTTTANTLTETTVLAAAADNTFTVAAVGGGYDNAGLEHHNVLDGNGHLVSLYRAYVVIEDIDLVPCTELSRLPRLLFDAIISTAHAHAGHGSEPVGGRSLDKPNVIDIVTQDEYYLPLGDIAAAPGRYCGVRVALARFPGDGYGKPHSVPASSDDPTTIPEIPDMNGRLFALRADYCSVDDGLGNCLLRSKIDIDDSGLNNPEAITITFNQEIEISSDLREAYIAVGIAYGTWLENVDASLLTTSPIERQKLLDNIAGSLHIYSKGLGDLPANI